MKVLELFCGTKSFTKVAEARGHECRTLDIDPSFNPTICKDITDFMPAFDFPGWHPDLIWASPPCEAFSTNTIPSNWRDKRWPKSQSAIHALEVIHTTLEIIAEIDPKWYVIENPRAMLRNLMPAVFTEDRKTVTYCQYEEGTPEQRRMKPTDIWTNIPFKPRACNYGDSCHRKTPRGTYFGESYEELAVVPAKLCEEILIACELSSSAKLSPAGVKEKDTVNLRREI